MIHNGTPIVVFDGAVLPAKEARAHDEGGRTGSACRRQSLKQFVAKTIHPTAGVHEEAASAGLRIVLETLVDWRRSLGCLPDAR